MFEEWPRILDEMGTPSRTFWWDAMKERGVNATEKLAEET